MRYFSIVFLAGLAMPALAVGVVFLLNAVQPSYKGEIFLTCMAVVSIAPGWLLGRRLKLPQRLDARYLPLILPPFLYVLLIWGILRFFGEVYFLEIVFWLLLAAVPYGLFLLGFLAGICRREAACLRLRGLCKLAAVTAVACLVCLVPIYPLLHNTFFYGYGDTGRYFSPWDYHPFNENNLARPDKAASLRIAANHPRITVPDSLLPLFSAIIQAIYAPEKEKDDPLFFCNILHRAVQSYAYTILAQNDADIAFAPQPCKRQLEMLRPECPTPVQTPIARTALVFFVHRDNPVQGLTAEQIRRIYAGDIERWSDIGGDDDRILLFQLRELDIQTVMQEMVMQGQLMETPSHEEYITGEGMKIKRRTADYRNRPDAIGYDFYWNALQRFPNGEIRLLAVDGILPTQENISNGSYPFSLPIVMLTCRPLSPEMKALHDWLLSPEGQALIAKTGFAPLPMADVP